MLAVRVERSKAEALRKRFAREDLIDKTHAIVDDGLFVTIPLTDAPSHDLLQKYGASMIQGDFPSRTSRRDPIDYIRDLVSIPVALKPLLPWKWELFGDVLVLRLDPALDRYETQVADAYASILKAKTVMRDVGGIGGEYRQPVIKILLGTDTIATHLENGIRFRFDVAKIMFSSGNVEERLRMAELECREETIIDMFAGIGYFSLPLAVHRSPKRIIACEINPLAHSYLVENIRLNDVGKTVEPVLGDNKDLEGEGIADRVIMGYVRTTHEFLPTALRLLKSGGVLHYHETCPNELLPKRPLQYLENAAKGAEVTVLRFKAIKSFAPGVSHVVVDARIVKPS